MKNGSGRWLRNKNHIPASSLGLNGWKASIMEAVVTLACQSKENDEISRRKDDRITSIPWSRNSYRFAPRASDYNDYNNYMEIARAR